MEDKELQEIKSMALSYGDPIRGKLLGLVASVEALKKHATDFEELYKQEHRVTNRYRKALEFYASFWSHDVQLEDIGITSVERDNGETARRVLEGKR